MHSVPLWSVGLTIFLETVWSKAWFALMIWFNLNGTGYEQMFFDSVLHLISPLAVLFVAYKLYYKKHAPQFMSLVCLVGAFISVRAVIQSWITLPRTLDKDSFYAASVWMTTAALALSAMEFFWISGMLMHQYHHSSKSKRHYRKKVDADMDLEEPLTGIDRKGVV